MTDTHFKTLITCCTIILAVCAILWDKILICSIILATCIIYFLFKKNIGKIVAGLLIFFYLITCFYVQARKPMPDVLSCYNEQAVTIKGMVSSLTSRSMHNKTKFLFDVTTLQHGNSPEKLVKSRTQVFLNNEEKFEISRGDYLKINANILVPENFGNEGEFNYAKFLENSNTFSVAFADTVEKLNIKPDLNNKILRNIDKIREKIILKHKQHLENSKVEILGGIVFGSEAIKPEIELKNIFIESGLYHLLAASGMNVAFIFGIWFFILIRLKVNYNFIIVSGGLLVLFYALMTGLPPSVTRATWMLELGLFGKLLDRKADNNVILFFVCAILLLYNPLLINDIGFLLSFIITFGLLTCTQPLMDLFKFLNAKISGWFIIPFIAQVFAIPIQIYYFQTISIYSILANMLVVPFMAIISFCGFVASILALVPKIGDWICFILDKINEPFLAFMYLVAKTFSSIPNNIMYVTKWNYIQVVLYYIIVFLVVYMIKNAFKNKKIIILTLITLLLFISTFTLKNYPQDLSFTFLNVGEGDSILITTPNKKRILVDTGRMYGKTRNSASSIILPFLSVNGINRLDIMLLTHPDTDHIAGSSDILNKIKVDKIITNGEKANNKSYLELQKYFNENHIKETVILKPTEISPDKDVSIIAIKPDNIDKYSQNDTSIILHIKYKNFDGILMGDNEINSLPILKKEIKPSGNIELFKIGHHASENSVNKEMGKFLSPEITVVSVGENSYGHPDLTALSYLGKSKILRTDFDGAIKIQTDGNKYDILKFNHTKLKWSKL